VEPSDMTEIDLDIRSYLYLRNVWEGTIIAAENRDFLPLRCPDHSRPCPAPQNPASLAANRSAWGALC
jgi:hypothetical protein